MIYPIVAYGDPVLKRMADEIDEGYEGLDQLIADMFETMEGAQGVGLAAPQIGKSIRLFIVDGTPFAEDEDLEDDETYGAAVEKFHEEKMIKAYKAANLAMGLGPSRPSPSIEGSAAQPADIAMS